MDRRTFLAAGAALAATLTLPDTPLAAGEATRNRPFDDGSEKKLPAPDMSGGKPLMACLAARRSNHRPGPEAPDLQDISNLLWAAWGINDDSGKHVVPTARNRRQLEVYIALDDGVWLYVPERHVLKRALAGDRRKSFDGAGCILLYAAPKDDKFNDMHVGSMYQGVGLYCASAGLQNCVKHQKHDGVQQRIVGAL